MLIRVPATSANLGPGFDSCGLALELYLEMNVMEETNEWVVEHNLGSEIPSDKTNLIVATALKVAPNLTPHHLAVNSEIPTTRGLGSSSSAIVAGIELANQLAELQLTAKQKIDLATEYEGHPDNVAPAILGGLVVAATVSDSVMYVKHDFPKCQVLVVVPETELATSASRAVLPKDIKYSTGVRASAIANVLVAAILSGDLNLAGEVMAKDEWHENYRQELIPDLSKVRELVKKAGGYGSCLSGAGPTILILTPQESILEIKTGLAKQKISGHVYELAIDNQGVQVK